MKSAKILISLLLIFSIIVPICTSVPLSAAGNSDSSEEEVIDYTPPEITHSKAAAVFNVEEEQFIFEKDLDKQIYPASTVKLMTAIVAVEQLGHDLERKVTVPVEAILKLQGNRIGLKRDEVVTVRELLYALICGCANDAANVLAIEIAGSVDEFVKLMNERAVELGAVNTNYTNPTGIHHPAMVTTGRDTTLIAAQAARSELILEMSSIEKYILQPTNKTGAREIYNKNCYFATNLEWRYIWSVPRGLNAGFTDEGGYCVATTASADGLTYIVVAMGADRDDKYIYSYTDASSLVKWALKSYGYQSVLTTSDMICEVPVKLASKVDYVSLFPSEPIELYLPKDVDIETDIKMVHELTDDHLVAPVREGQVAGKLRVTFLEDGKERLLGVYDLITRNGVNRNNFLYIFDLLGGLTETSWFRTALIIAIVCAAFYIGALVWLSIPRRPKLPGKRGKQRRR